MMPSFPTPAAPATDEPAPAGPPADVAAEQPPPTGPSRPRRTPWVVLTVAGAAIVLSLGWWAGNREEIALLMSYRAFEDQPWRLFTSTLIHADVVHLAFNLYWLWILGRPVEVRWGPMRALGVILLLAAGSAAAEYAHSDGGVGLSGVAYGLFGMIWVLGRSDP